MGGGRDNSGAVRYYRRNGIYFRKDGKPVNHRFRNINITIEDHMALANMAEPITEQRTNILRVLENRVLDKFEHPTATDRAAMTPLPQTGREVLPFLQNTMAIADLNDWQRMNNTNNRISRIKRKEDSLVDKIMSGDIVTEKGGFVFNERKKNRDYLHFNDISSAEDAINQVIPQLLPENLRQIIHSGIYSVIDGVQEDSNLFVFEVYVRNNSGQNIKTYAKVHQFHDPDGKPYTVLVSMHRPMRGRISDQTTDTQKGL